MVVLAVGLVAGPVVAVPPVIAVVEDVARAVLGAVLGAVVIAVAGSAALMAMPVPRAVATPMLSDAAIARPRGAVWVRRRR
jgi:hypothetical protein